MLYIREHADQWHIDMDKVAVCGFSAGAYASAMYSVYYNQPIITEFLGIDAEGIHPAAAILGYTLSDYVALMGTDPIVKTEAMADKGRMYWLSEKVNSTCKSKFHTED